MGKKLVINCKTHQQEWLDETIEEIADGELRRTKAAADEAIETEKAAKKTAALDKLKLDPKNNDLLIALGLIEPELEAK